ncbi:hypothetical protein ACFLSW_03920 [Candidatus Bipolaricaulota bacterium]|jgi:hypothetical protein
MPSESREANPMAFLTVGLCLVGAGVAMGVALMSRGAGSLGLVLIACGVCFVAIGFGKKRAAESSEAGGEESDLPPT